MASLLLLLQAIIGGIDEGLLCVEREVQEEVKQPELFCPSQPVAHRRCTLGDDDVEERWLVACLQWPRTNRQSAWMQAI
jgi:hypothetical protein